ncbi:MAG: hypothetical protein HKN23_00795 [Verrucomicrobiales bacterium]|nr:hypothetical protein [Verrucomicrobiales bacterium]
MGQEKPETADTPRLSTWTQQNLIEWWEVHPDPDSWISAGPRLQAALLAAQEQYGLDKVFENKHFRGWMIHLNWIELFPSETFDADPFWSKPETLDMFRQLSLGGEIPRLLASSLDSRDNGEKALDVLMRIAVAHPDVVGQLPTLAVAYAVVFDQPFPESWPHPFAKQEWMKIANHPVEDRFEFFLESLKARQIYLDPKKLSVRDLTYAVDSPLELTEFRYAQQVKINGIGQLAELYPAVKYDFPRAQRGDFLWPHGENYHLFEIGKRGGICADQAFFVSQTAKAKGIPSLFFLGQGRSGGHAWVGFMSAPGRWELDVAKYRGEKYPVGVAYDPQTWRRVTDAQFRFLTQEQVSNDRYEGMQLTLRWAEMNPDADFYGGLLRHARKFVPRWFSTWELEAEFLKDHPRATREVKERFWRMWITNFQGEVDMRTRGQVSLLQLLRAEGDDRAAERLEAEIIQQNKSERFDLAIKVAAEMIFLHMDRGDWDLASKECERQLTKFKRDSGGHLFYNLVQPFVERCLEAGRRELAAKAVADLGEVFQPAKNSMLDQDISDLRRLVGTPPPP